MMEAKNMTDKQLNTALEVLLGAEEDKHRPGNVIKGTYSVRPKNYSGDPASSLSLQEKVIEQDMAYVVLLHNIVTGMEEELYSSLEVADMLTANPRQRAEAAYMTLIKGETQ